MSAWLLTGTLGSALVAEGPGSQNEEMLGEKPSNKREGLLGKILVLQNPAPMISCSARDTG